MATTLLAQLVNPEVMADAISAELPAKLATLGYMKVDTSLVGKAGNTVHRRCNPTCRGAG